jgi:hypothetical protein
VLKVSRVYKVFRAYKVYRDYKVSKVYRVKLVSKDLLSETLLQQTRESSGLIPQ